MDSRTLDLAPYRTAIHEKICSFCLDHDEEGGCRRPADEPCSLVNHLDLVVPAILSVGRSMKIDDYVAALRQQVCPNCREDDHGRCELRKLSDCALDSYLLRVVDVIETVATARGHIPRPHPRRRA